MRGVSVIPRAVSLRVSISQSTGILGIPLPALLSNTVRLIDVNERSIVKSVGAVRLRALPFSLVQQGCLRCGVSRCGPAAVVVGRGC